MNNETITEEQRIDDVEYYGNLLHQNESIAYADLPWAEKQQNTLSEQKMEKLFPTKRLDATIERLFESASEVNAKQQYEEDFLKKDEE